MSSYSKAPRGLFVLLRVMRIFTHSSISPGLSLRHCSTRYAFRAGRNLPDKEFRYLRTVIVTAAVHRGFSSKLSPLPLTFRHWAGVSPYTSPYEFAETCVFVKQSVEPFLCGLRQLHVKTFHQQRRSLFLSYGSKLPSSLTRVLPIAIRYTLPVHLCRFAVRAPKFQCLEAFLGSMGSTTSGRSTATIPQTPLADLPTRITVLQIQNRDIHHPAGLPFCVPPSLHFGGAVILNCCPSPTLFSLSLGPTNPTRNNLPSETLDIRRI